MKYNFLNILPATKIEFRKRGKNEDIIFEQLSHILVIVIKGKFELKIEDVTAGCIEWGQLILLPSGKKYVLHCKISTEILIFYLPDCIALMEKFFPKDLYALKKTIPHTPTLAINTLLWEYIRNTQTLANECNFYPTFQRIKQAELFCILGQAYSPELLTGFFHPFICYEDSFSDFIWNNYSKVKTAQEFAALANQSISSFEKRFKITFGISPYKWMMERKKEKLIHEIIHSGDQMQELSDKCGFSSPSQMVEFCKKHIGLTPGEIRKRSRL